MWVTGMSRTGARSVRVPFQMRRGSHHQGVPGWPGLQSEEVDDAARCVTSAVFRRLVQTVRGSARRATPQGELTRDALSTGPGPEERPQEQPCLARAQRTRHNHTAAQEVDLRTRVAILTRGGAPGAGASRHHDRHSCNSVAHGLGRCCRDVTRPCARYDDSVVPAVDRQSHEMTLIAERGLHESDPGRTRAGQLERVGLAVGGQVVEHDAAFLDPTDRRTPRRGEGRDRHRVGLRHPVRQVDRVVHHEKGSQSTQTRVRRRDDGREEVGRAVSTDLLAAVIAATHARLRGLGALLVMDDSIHLADRVTKTHAMAVSTFASPWGAPIGRVEEGRVVLDYLPADRRPDPLELPGSCTARVALMEATLGDEGHLVRLAVDGAYDGIVIAGAGAGHVSAIVAEVVGEAVARVPVVMATRTGAGRTATRKYGYPGAEVDLLGRGVIMAGALLSLIHISEPTRRT